MRFFLSAVFFITMITAFGQTTRKNRTYTTVKTFFTDLNNDNITDTIILSSSLPEKTSFNRISILMSGAKRKTFRAKDSWADIDDWFLDSNKNSVKSKIIFIKKTEKHTVIILSGGTDAAGYGGEFSIINIENNNIKMVFDHSDDDIDVEDPVKLFDMQNDGRLCFVYTTIYEYVGFSNKTNQEKGTRDIGSYHPYFVYPVDDSCKLNKILSRKYMEEHYVFAGFKYNDKLRILYPRNGGKPRIWKKKYLH